MNDRFEGALLVYPPSWLRFACHGGERLTDGVWRRGTCAFWCTWFMSALPD